jgi:hypothetical protein
MTYGQPCASCGKSLEGRPGPLCAVCEGKSGLRPAGAMRRLSPCVKCGHRVLIRAQVRERGSVSGSDTTRERAAPLAVTYATGEEYKMTGLLSFDKIPSLAPDLDQPFGILEAYVCRSCGFTEWYARDPEQIPIGDVFGTQLVEV